MKFVIIGAGDVGVSLCQRLSREEHDVVLIEKNETITQSLSGSADMEIITGNGCSPEILSQAGIGTADYIIAVTNSDEVNMAAVLVGRLFNPSAKRVARIRDLNLDFDPLLKNQLNEYFDLIINPDKAAADYLLQVFQVPGAKEVVDFADGSLLMVAIEVTSDSPIANKELKTIPIPEDQLKFLLIGIVRDDRLIIPRGNHSLQPGDIAYAITVPEKIKLLFELAGGKMHNGREVMIWGGTPVATHLARELEAHGTHVKLVLSNPHEASILADQFTDTLVLVGEGTDKDLLFEENIGEEDAFIAATPDEGNNVLAALLSKKLGAKSSMALVRKGTYLPLVSRVGIDAVVSSRIAAASAIFAHIHADSVIAGTSLHQYGANLVEIKVTPGMKIIDSSIQDLKLPTGIIIAAIVRKDESVIPRGHDIVHEGDTLIIFFLENARKKLEKVIDRSLEHLIHGF